MRRLLRGPRLSFAAKFGIVVVLLGAVVAGAVLYIPITQGNAEAHQAALDSVSAEGTPALGARCEGA